MENLTDEIVNTRTGYPLNEDWKKCGGLEKQKFLIKLIREMEGKLDEGQKKLFERIQTAYMEQNSLYINLAYRRGYQDGIQAGVEKKAGGIKTYLSLEDMTTLVSIYDASKKLSNIMIGKNAAVGDGSILGVLERVENVIEHAISIEIYYSEDFDGAVDDLITHCLYNEELTAEEKAGKLLGLS